MLNLEEQSELSAFIEADTDKLLVSEGVDEIFAATLSFQKDISVDSVNEALNQWHQKKNKPSIHSVFTKKSRTLRIWTAAASVALIVGLTAYFLFQPEPIDHLNKKVVATKKGTKTNIVLPDGTKVWINADTKLTYDLAFGKQSREVQLVGEAFFDVKKDSTRPFIVHTSTYDIRVLGTAFNVRAYPGETNSQTTLLRGRVEVVLKNNHQDKIILKPNDKLVVQNNATTNGSAKSTKVASEVELTTIADKKKDSTVLETEWTKNRLVFEQEKIENLLPVLERWYNVTIELRHSSDGILYNGVFENDSLEDVLSSLKEVGGFNYRIEKNLNFVVVGGDWENRFNESIIKINELIQN